MTILVVFALALTFFAAIAFYSSMPEHMATHWNSKGQVDGWMHKSAGMFVVPTIALFTVLLLYGVLLVDPLRKNIRKFMAYYGGLILSLTVFLLAAQLVHGDSQSLDIERRGGVGANPSRLRKIQGTWIHAASFHNIGPQKTGG